MWFESSSLNSVNLEKKIYYSSKDIVFFLGGYFFMARPVYSPFHIAVSCELTDYSRSILPRTKKSVTLNS